MMAIQRTCNGCGTPLGKTQVYYSIGDITKHMPKKPYRVIFHEGTSELRAEDTGWVDYADIDLCIVCVQHPFDIGTHIQQEETHG